MSPVDAPSLRAARPLALDPPYAGIAGRVGRTLWHAGRLQLGMRSRCRAPVAVIAALVVLGIPTLRARPALAAAGPALSVDAGADRHAISPYIYGMNFADEGLAAELQLPLRRFGGNATTRYNWQNDTSNHASDWYFENIPNDNPNPAALPDGSSSDRFVDQDRRTGTATLLTVPLIGWTPKARAVACGFGVEQVRRAAVDRSLADELRQRAHVGRCPDHRQRSDRHQHRDHAGVRAGLDRPT